jgi:hypothetical protein
MSIVVGSVNDGGYLVGVPWVIRLGFEPLRGLASKTENIYAPSGLP